MSVLHTSSAPARRRHVFRLYVVSLAVCLAGNLAARLIVETASIAAWVPMLIAVLATVPLIAMSGMLWHTVRRDLDEMLQRIVLEGLALGMLVFVPIAAICLNLKASGALRLRIDAADVLLLPMALVAGGVALAWRKYA